jgi:hypothetical protein
MARRESFYITPNNPARVFALDWLPASMSVINTSNYTVYVAVGERIVPTANNNTGIVPPFSSYTAAPGGAYVFSVAVDHAGDTVPFYLYPITVSFSEVAGDISAPLSASFPNTVKQQLILYSKAQTITGTATIQWDRSQSNLNQGTISTTQIFLHQDSVVDVSVHLNITGLTLSPTIAVVAIFGSTMFAALTESFRSGQSSTTIDLRKIIGIKASDYISVNLAFTPSTASGTLAADTSTLTLNVLS